jgi:predicted nucleic acid-binding protein
VIPRDESYWPELRSAIEQGRISGSQVHDARVAAICREHGVRELWTSDRDFSRFSTLTVVNPLVG